MWHPEAGHRNSMDQVFRSICYRFFPVGQVQTSSDAKMEPEPTDERIYYPHDLVFAKLFPSHSRMNKSHPPFLSSTPQRTLLAINDWASNLARNNRRCRGLTLDLRLDLKKLAQGVIPIATRTRGDEQKHLEQVCLAIRDATELFHRVCRENSMHFMMKELVELDLDNLQARYVPGSALNQRLCRQIPSPFAVHASYICEQVRLEAAAFGRWKDEIEHGEASAMCLEQPPRLWNNMLADVTRHARDIHYFDFPERFSFESILRILENTHLLRLDAEQPGSFPYVTEFDQFHELDIAETLVEDLWTLEVRYRVLKDSYDLKDIRRSIHQAIEERYCRVQLTASGRLCGFWKDDGSENGKQTMVVDKGQSHERNGVPWVKVVNGRVVTRNPEPQDSTDARWDVDIGRVRGVVVLIWDNIDAPPPPYKDQLPSYEEVVDQPPILEGDLMA
ncbi:hypothetical protein EDB81DRAFT_7705 [Dactylonectria macrodidyma]|uniref:Uncharacterized protein n=1 Tax=Dactylonectria macrodidyma TaxID=307937 RepID=A0A9P9FQX3_9HYPO|nr:hypothetical protein EDB81DRAFT_7705 [Dactylonectria macrodidyma]